MAHPSTRAKSKMLWAFIVFISASYLELKAQKRFCPFPSNEFLSFFLVYDNIPWKAAKYCIFFSQTTKYGLFYNRYGAENCLKLCIYDHI